MEVSSFTPKPDSVAGRLPASQADKRWSRLPSTSPAMRLLEEAIGRVADFQCPVLVTGETGCGKEEVARAIHAAGPRRKRPFVAINCGGLVASLAESQLFGHAKGAFTGAMGAFLGGFRSADGGVVFLDEIGEMPLELQPKLLRVLQRGDVSPVGSTETYHVDVQVIAATNRELEAAVAAGTFRDDLFYRLNTVHLVVPPLRSRPEDIPRLIEHFASFFAAQYDRPVWRPTGEVLSRLVSHTWPGNVRQLAQMIQRIYIFDDRVELLLEELAGSGGSEAVGSASAATAAPGPNQPASLVAEAPFATSAAVLTPPAADVVDGPVLPLFNLDELRRLAVQQSLAKTDGHRGRAAELLGVSLNTMTRLVVEFCPDAAAKAGRKRIVKPR